MSGPTRTPCVHCGRSVDEHCIYEPVNAPGTCVCDPLSWNDPAEIPPVCEAYIAIDSRPGTYCARCEHDERCHG